MPHMRLPNLWQGLLVTLVAGLLIGCGDTSTAGASDSNAPKKEGSDFKVALLTPGPVSDAGWSAMAYDGLQAIKKEYGAEVDNQVVQGPEIKDAMRNYAQKGYKLVFGHGFEYNEPGVAVAKDFPNTVFVSSSGGLTAKNAGAIRFYLEQGFYLAGVLAAEASKTGVVGMVGGPDVPSIKSTFKAFRAGAEFAKPGIKVLETFTGKNDDIAAAKQATLSQIDQKADVIIHQANAAAKGVFDACKEKGVYALGANANQNDDDSGVILASAVIQAQPAFLELAKLVKEGKFDANVVTIGMEKKAIDLVINEKLKDKIPAAGLAKVDEVRKSIVDGKFVVPKDKF